VLKPLGKKKKKGVAALENQDFNFWLDPYRVIISELVRSYGEKSSESWAWNNNQTEVVTVHKDDTPMRRMLILFEPGKQLFVLRTIGFDFQLFAYLGNLNDEQASYMKGFLAGYLADVFWPLGPMPMDFDVYDHTSSRWLPEKDKIYFTHAPFEDNDKVRAFSEFLDEGHWAHLAGLRPAAARYMTEFIALELVLDTWIRFVQAIRHDLKINFEGYPSKPVLEKVKRFLDLNPGIQVDRNIDNWTHINDAYDHFRKFIDDRDRA
jgi:hypothetical protein